MVLALTVGTFLATVIVFISLFYAFTPGESWMVRRLSNLSDVPAPVPEGAFAEKQKQRVRDALTSIGSLAPGKSTPRTQLLMMRAGYRNPGALSTLQGLKVILPIVLVSVVYFTGLYSWNPILILAGALLAGFLLPEVWVVWRVNVRQRRLRRALPDALDLLVICVEVGLGLDQAIMRVAQELKVVHRELSEELQLVILEMRVGKTRLEALRDLSVRTGVDDLKSLVAMLVQTERFGTSVAQSLRVYSDEMRIRRRQRAEEMGAKTSVKMVFPLVLFIFPALMVVVAGPAIIMIWRELIHGLR